MNRKKLLYTIAAIIVVGLILFVSLKKKEEKSIVKLNTEVYFDGTKFEIHNLDTVDFFNADISVDKYYKIRNINLKAGETYTIWKVEFLHHNGTHFPPKRTPIQFSIWCELNHDLNGYYSKNLN